MESIIVTKDNIEALDNMIDTVRKGLKIGNITPRDFDYIYCQIARLLAVWIRYAIENESEFKNGYNLNKGLIIGLFVRIYKILLYTDKLLYTDNMTYEVAMLLQRKSLELCALAQYLIKNRDNEEVFEKYRNNALTGENELYNQVLEDINNANGVIQPIQDRILKSIDSKFKLLHIDRNKKVGKFISIKQIFDEIEQKKMYDLAYRVGSHSMHADAMSTVTCDLKHNEKDDKYYAEFNKNEFDIRLYNSKLILILYALKDFIEIYNFDFDKDTFMKEGEILIKYIKLLEQLHEEYINI